MPPLVGNRTLNMFKDRGIEAKWMTNFWSPCKNKVNHTRYLDQVKEADAVFFTSGFSENLISCLLGEESSNVDTPILQEIRKKITFFAGGASLVNSKNFMLLSRSSIESYTAILTGKVPHIPYSTKIFQKGLIEVSISERFRQGKLFIFGWKTKSRWAFGIEDNTALIEQEDGTIVIKGSKGVLVYDNELNELKNVKMHYLTEGDMIKGDRIIYPTWKKPCATHNNLPNPSRQIFRDFKNVSMALSNYHESATYVGVLSRDAGVVQVIMEKTVETVAMCGQFNQTSFHSFSNLKVSMGKRV
jgi:cyanophycinase-like exopeptidase